MSFDNRWDSHGVLLDCRPHYSREFISPMFSNEFVRGMWVTWERKGSGERSMSSLRERKIYLMASTGLHNDYDGLR